MRLLSGEIKPGQTVEVDVEHGALSFRVAQAEPAPV
jgi:hypothetical protein